MSKFTIYWQETDEMYLEALPGASGRFCSMVHILPLLAAVPGEVRRRGGEAN